MRRSKGIGQQNIAEVCFMTQVIPMCSPLERMTVGMTLIRTHGNNIKKLINYGNNL